MLPRPASSPSASSSSISSLSSGPNIANMALRLGKQPLPKELDWQLYQEEVLDKSINAEQLSDSGLDLTSGPRREAVARFNDVLHELLAIEFTRTKLEARPGTASSSLLAGAPDSVASAEASGSKRDTQDTMLTVPLQTLEAGLGVGSCHDNGGTTISETSTADDAEAHERSQPPAPKPDSDPSDDGSDDDDDGDGDGSSVQSYAPHYRDYRYLSRREKVKQALRKVKLAPTKASASVKKAVMGESRWSASPYFLYDEYRVTADSKGLVDKLKLDIQPPGPSTLAWRLYARVREPYFKPPGTTRRECASCTDTFNVTDIVTLDCKHRYCEECLKMMVMVAAQQESTMPPKCCGANVRPGVIKRVLKTEEDKIKFSRKIIEYDTAIEKRLFCPRRKCGAFIPYHPRKDQSHPLIGTCQKCGTKACRICKGKSHKRSEDCPQDLGLDAVIQMSKSNGWKRCHRCRAMIELNYGCNHMTCRCGAEFCYICGNPWSPEFGCPSGCSQTDDEMVAHIVDEMAEQARIEAETAAAEVTSRSAQEAEAKRIVEERLQKTQEDMTLKALMKTQKEELVIFSTYSENVIFRLKRRHYEETTDLQLEHVSQALAHNSELEDRTLEYSRIASEAEAEYCAKLGLSVEDVTSGDHADNIAAIDQRLREQMLQMKVRWDDERSAISQRHQKGKDKLHAQQRLEEQVAQAELTERRVMFRTEQRRVLNRVVGFRVAATNETFVSADALYDNIVCMDDEEDMEKKLFAMAIADGLIEPTPQQGPRYASTGFMSPY